MNVQRFARDISGMQPLPQQYFPKQDALMRLTREVRISLTSPAFAFRVARKRTPQLTTVVSRVRLHLARSQQPE